MKLALVVIIIFTFINCSSTEHSQSLGDKSDNALSKTSLLESAKERFGVNYNISANKNWDYFLVTNFSKSQLEVSTKFFVYDSTSAEIILEDFIRAGSVKWVDDYKIDVQIHPGNIQMNSNKTDLGYIFDCKTKTKFNK